MSILHLLCICLCLAVVFSYTCSDSNTCEIHLSQFSGSDNTLVAAIGELMRGDLGLNGVISANTAAQRLFNDLIEGNMNHAEVVTRIRKMSREYTSLQKDTSRIVMSISDSATDLMKYLRILRHGINTASAVDITASLQVMAKRIEELKYEFHAHEVNYRTILNEVLDVQVKVDELTKSEEWKLAFVEDCRVWDHTLRRCVEFTDNFTPVAISSLAAIGTGVLAPAAFFLGGPAGYLTVASVISFMAYGSLAEYAANKYFLIKSYNDLRDGLVTVHEYIHKELDNLERISRALRGSSSHVDLIVELSKGGSSLLNLVLDDTEQKMVSILEACTSYPASTAISMSASTDGKTIFSSINEKLN